MSKTGFDFEAAVFSFVKALDPSAEVLFNHKVRDRDAGTMRQCDVWINARFGGHLPLSILVSCKDHKRKLNIGDIGTFCDEVRSTGASTGVIYSRGGFTKPAIAKAKSNGISCCRLYQKEPPDIPNLLCFDHFACYLSIKLALISDLRNTEFRVWNDIFDIKNRDDNTSVLEFIVKIFIEEGDKIVSEFKEIVVAQPGTLPQDWRTEISFKLEDIDKELRIQVWGLWKLYRARAEASLLNGSYCLTDESFKGEMIGPAIDIKGKHPGKQWQEITDKSLALPSNMIMAILHHPTGVNDLLRTELGPKEVFPDTHVD